MLNISNRNASHSFIMIALILMLVFSPVGFYMQSAGAEEAVSTNVQLDLSSQNKDLSAGSLFSAHPGVQSATINVGGNSVAINASSSLTPAEFLALSQVLSGQTQSFSLSNAGTVSGGTVDITSLSGYSNLTLGSLIIPQGIIAAQDFGVANALNLSGNLTNSGSLYAYSTIAGFNTANISALNIFNNQSALISSVLPGGGLTGINSALSSLNLNLMAVQNIVNAGSIVSSGNLTAVAGGSISNLGNMAVMQAVNNINLQAANILNTGTIAAQLGNMNIATQQLTNNALMQAMAGNINVINSLAPLNGLSVMQSDSGVMEALQGTIDFNVTDSLLKTNMDIEGGSLFAGESLNINAGEGHLNVEIKDVSGPIDIHAGTANFAVSHGTHGMYLRTFDITGDPNIIYSGSGPYSSGAVNTDGGYVSIDTSSDTSNGSITFTGTINTTPSFNADGGRVYLNAGTFVSTQDIVTTAFNDGTGGQITITANDNVTTGNITASGVAGWSGHQVGQISIQAGADGSGNLQTGSITAAVADNAALERNLDLRAAGSIQTGAISYDGVVYAVAGTSITATGNINTTPTGTQSGGNVFLNAGTFISAQNIDTSANTDGDGGHITLRANDNITAGTITSSAISGGNRLPGKIFIYAGNDGSGNVSVGAITGLLTGTSNARYMDINANGTVTTGQITYQGTVNVNATGNITITGIDARLGSGTGEGLVSVRSTGGFINISTNGLFTTGREINLIAPTNTVTVTSGITTTNSSGNGGDLHVVATAFTAQDGGSAGTIDTRSLYGAWDPFCGCWVGHGGLVHVYTTGSISTRAILTSGDTTAPDPSEHRGQGGGILLSAGTSGTGNITTLDLTQVSQGFAYRTSTYIMAPGTISVGNLNMSSPTSGNGNHIYIVAGTSSTGGTLTIGNVATNGAGLGGNFTAINLTSNAAVNIGTINTSAGGDFTFGGMVSIVGHGAITTSTITGTGLGNSSAGANVFITSGVSSGTAVTTGNINVSGNAGNGFGGNLWFVRNAGAGTTLGTITQTGGGGNGVTFNGAPTNQTASITGNLTVTIDPGTVDRYNPGGYTSINASSSTLTLTTNNTILIPIVSRTTAITLGAITINNNWATPVYELVANGNVTLNGSITHTGTASPSVSIYSNNGGSVTLQSVDLSNTNNGWLAGGLEVMSQGNISLANSYSIDTRATNNGTGGVIQWFATGGSILLGSAGNTSNNFLSSDAFWAPGNTAFYARDNFTDYSVTISASSDSGNGANLIVRTLAGSINLYNLYDATNNYNASLLSEGSNSGGGYVVLSGNAGINVLRDNTLCCAGTNTQSISTSGAVFGQLMSVFSRFGNIDLTNNGSLDSTGGTGFGGFQTIIARGNIVTPMSLDNSGSLGANTVNIGLQGLHSTLTVNGDMTAAFVYVDSALGNSTHTSGRITAQYAQFTSFVDYAGYGGFGSEANPILVDLDNLYTRVGSGYFSELNDITLDNADSPEGTFSILAGGNLNTSFAFAKNLHLETTGSGTVTTTWITRGSNIEIVTQNYNNTGFAIEAVDWNALTAGSLTIESPINLTITNWGGNPTLSAWWFPDGGGDATISAVGTLSMPTVTLDASGFCCVYDKSGGTINISGSTITVTGGALNLLADATGIGNGGTISVTTTGSTGDIVTGSGTGNFNASADGGWTSGNGGSITLSAGRSLTINTADISASAIAGNGNGGSITLVSGSNGSAVTPALAFTGAATVSTNGIGTGDGGTIIIQQLRSTGTLTLTTTTAFTANAGGTSGNGGTIEITTPAFQANLPGTGAITLSADANGTGNGGTVTLTTTGSSGAIIIGNADNTFTINARGGTTNGNGGLVTVSAGQNLTVNMAQLLASVRGTNGNGGRVYLTSGTATTGTMAFTATATYNLNGAGTGNGGIMSIISSGALTLTTMNTLNANAGTQGNGGQITIQAPTWPNIPGTGPLNLSANGGGTGNGGQISVTTTASTTTLIVGTASDNINASITSGASGGNGGTLTVSAGEGLTVNAAGITEGPLGANGNGSNFNFTAGTAQAGTLTIALAALNISANGVGNGDGGAININQSNSASSISITASVGGGTLSANKGGSGTTNGQINMAIAGTGVGAVTIGTNATVQGDDILITTNTLTNNANLNSTATNGSITINSNGALTLNGTPASAVSVAGGSAAAYVLVEATGANALTIASDYTFNAGVSGMVLLDSDATGGSIVLNSSVDIVISSSIFIGFFAPQTTLNASSTITASGSGQFIEISSSNLDHNVTLPSGGTATISANNGGIVYFGPYDSSDLTFNSSGGSLATLTVNASMLQLYSAGTMSFNNNTLIQGSGTIWVRSDGGTVNFAGNGQLRATGATSWIHLNSWWTNLTINGTTGAIRTTGGAASGVQISAPGTINIGSNLTVDVGSGGSAGYLNITGGVLSIADGVTLISTGGIALPVAEVLLGNGSVLHSNVSSGSAIGNPAGLQAFTIRGVNGGTGTISTGGGSINLWSYGTMAFDKVSGTTTLNLNGGTVNIWSNNGATTIRSGVTLNSSNDINFNVRIGTVEANGQINTTSSGSIRLVAHTGTLSIGANAIFYAEEGNIIIRNIDTSGGTISLASGSDIHAYTLSNPLLGNVTLVIGTQNASSVDGTPPANVTVNESGGGQVYFGTNGITTSGPTNTLNAIARNITFDSGSAPATSIYLGGGVTITADPPIESTVIADLETSSTLTTFGNDLAMLALTVGQFNSDSHSTVISTDVLPVSNLNLFGPNLNFGNAASAVSNPLSIATSNFADSKLFANGDISTTPSNSSQNDDASSAQKESSLLDSISYVRPKDSDNILQSGIAMDEEFTSSDFGHSLELVTGKAKCSPDCRVSIAKDGSLVLKKGEILLLAEEDSEILVGKHKVFVSKGTMSVVSLEDKLLRVCNLYESSRKDIQVEIAGQQISVCAGEELLLAEKNAEEQLSSKLNSGNVGRRMTLKRELTGGRRLAHSEISLVALMQDNQLINALMHSVSKSDLSAKEKLVKMAACLMVVTGKHGAYFDNTGKSGE